MTYNDFIKYVEEHTDRVFVLNVTGLFESQPYLKKFIETSDFTTAPASTKYHGSYPGGLLEHSVNVMYTLCKLTENNKLSWYRPESPIIVGLFHDICKTDQYKREEAGHLMYSNEDIKLYNGCEYNNETLFKGHGDKSVMMLASLIQLTEEEVACIRYHMGAFTDKEEWNDYTRAIHKYPNVLWTHHADMIATHIMEYKEDI
jgi:hypothetical protein